MAKMQLVIVGGEVDCQLNSSCWKVEQSGGPTKKLFEVPSDILSLMGSGNSVCKTP